MKLLPGEQQSHRSQLLGLRRKRLPEGPARSRRAGLLPHLDGQVRAPPWASIEGNSLVA